MICKPFSFFQIIFSYYFICFRICLYLWSSIFVINLFIQDLSLTSTISNHIGMHKFRFWSEERMEYLAVKRQCVLVRCSEEVRLQYYEDRRIMSPLLWWPKKATTVRRGRGHQVNRMDKGLVVGRLEERRKWEKKVDFCEELYRD